MIGFKSDLTDYKGALEGFHEINNLEFRILKIFDGIWDCFNKSLNFIKALA